MATAEIIVEYALEFECTVWLLSVDLRKAFDTVDHAALFATLSAHGISDAYIALIGELHSGQHGVVHGSDAFPSDVALSRMIVPELVCLSVYWVSHFKNGNHDYIKKVSVPRQSD